MPEKPTVLVIDDEEIIRTSAKRILKDYAVSTAPSGKAGLKEIQQKNFDLVLTDLRMPDIDGLEVLKQVKEIAPETEVIIITGYGTIKTAVEALKHGAYDYIEKPFTPEGLQNVVSRCLESKRLLIENLRLRKEVHALYSLENIIGNSKAMQKVFELIATVAPTGSTVLITGGKRHRKRTRGKSNTLQQPTQRRTIYGS